MNKSLTLLAVFVFLSLPAFPQGLPLSTGYGVTLGANFDTLTAKLNNGSLEARQHYNQFNYGGLVFFDAVYITADISFSGSVTTFVNNNELKKYTYINDNYVLAGANLGFGLYGKYPFNLGGGLLLFPLLGLQASIGLAQNFAKDFDAWNAKKGENYGNALDWSVLAFKVGAGIDFDLNETIFLRGGLLLIYKLNSLLDQSFVDAVNKARNSNAINTNFGFEFEFLIGYKIMDGGASTTSFAPRNDQDSDDDDVFYPE